MTQSQSQSQPRFNLPQKQQTETASSNKASKKPEAKIKPEIKEKPLFSTFKQREQNDSFRSNKGKALFKRQQENSSVGAPRSPLSKVASESDLTQSLNLPQVNGDEVEPISITVNATFAKQQLEREGTGSDSGSNKLVIDTSRDNSV